MKLPQRFPTKLILISATILGIGAGATLYMVNQPQPAEEKSSLIVRQDPIGPMQEAETVVDAPEAPVIVEANTNPSSNTEAQPEPPVQPEAHRYAAEMAAAGISESDFVAVDALVLAPYGWRVLPTPENNFVWRLSHQTQGTLTEKLSQVKLYVEVTYEGSFQEALDTARLGRNF